MSDTSESPALYALLDQQAEQHKENRALLLEVVQRMATVETKLDTVVGDKQPGRLTLVEQSVKELQSYKWRMAGIVTGASAVISASVAVLVKINW